MRYGAWLGGGLFLNEISHALVHAREQETWIKLLNMLWGHYCCGSYHGLCTITALYAARHKTIPIHVFLYLHSHLTLDLPCKLLELVHVGLGGRPPYDQSLLLIRFGNYMKVYMVDLLMR